MSPTRKNSSRITQGIAIMLGLLLCGPFYLVGTKTVSAYSDLQDIRFQGEKLLQQQQMLNRDLQMQQDSLSVLQTSFKPLGGSAAQANAELQTRLRTLITTVGGIVETSTQINPPKISSDGKQSAPSSFSPVFSSIRWSVSEDGLAQFLAKTSAPEQNLKIDSLLIRRRQGTASLLDIRMQCSALWQDPSKTEMEASP